MCLGKHGGHCLWCGRALLSLTKDQYEHHVLSDFCSRTQVDLEVIVKRVRERRQTAFCERGGLVWTTFAGCSCQELLHLAEVGQFYTLQHLCLDEQQIHPCWDHITEGHQKLVRL